MRNDVSKIKSLLTDKTKLKEFGLNMEREMEKKIVLNNNQSKPEENILNESLNYKKIL